MRILSFLASLFLAAVLVVGCDSTGTNTESLGDSTAVAFTQSTVVAPEDTGSVNLTIEIRDPGFKEFSVTVAVDESQSTATLGEDVTGPADTTITFPQSTTAGETAQLSYSVVDDSKLLEGDETLVVTVSSEDGASPGETGTFTLTIEDNDETNTIAEARAFDDGERAVVTGIVTRVEEDGVYLQDETAGIFVFDSDFAASVTAGDEVRVDGTLDSFNGLRQLGSVSGSDLTETLSTGNPLPDPAVISLEQIVNNGEEYESELIRVEGFTIDPDGDQTFQAGGAAGNYAIRSDGTQSTLRIPSGSELEGEDIPFYAVFEGVLGQFSSSDPSSGYQLLGFLLTDLTDLQDTVSGVRQESNETLVATAGVVTRKDGINVFLEDDSGATGASGLNVRSSDLADAIDAGDVNIGDRILVGGELGAFSGLLQISGDVVFRVDEAGVGIPTPQTITVADIQNGGGEDYESEFVAVEQLTFENGGGTFESGTNYAAEGPNGNTITVRITSNSFYSGASIPTGEVTVQAPLSQFNGGFGGAREPDEGYQLLPLLDGDIQ